jgi:hypothetical protein
MGDCMHSTSYSASTSIARLHTWRDSNQKTWLHGRLMIPRDNSVVASKVLRRQDLGGGAAGFTDLRRIVLRESRGGGDID